MTSVLVQTLLLGVISLTLHTAVEAVEEQCGTLTSHMEWNGSYIANFSSQTLRPFLGLNVTFTFNLPVTRVNNWGGSSKKINDTHFRLITGYKFAETGTYVNFQFNVFYEGNSKPLIIAIDMNGQDACDGSVVWVPGPSPVQPCQPTGMKKYDYSQALCMSFLFYEAQRSGQLPEEQRVTGWRWNSAMNDGADVGHDLTGGYYDAGDHVKFGFPMAFTATVLAWGLLDFREGYDKAGQTEYGRAAIKWATDYFLKAHTGEYELYGQVGSGHLDHDFWGRPEDMVMKRPSMKIDRDAPGTELACETAAALAAASLVFKEADPVYSVQLLKVAEELFSFGDEYRLEYHQSIPDVFPFYRSYSGYGDELLWGALWLYRATGDTRYLNKAQAAWEEFNLGKADKHFSWDDKKPGAYALGWMLQPNNTMYEDALKAYLSFLKIDAPYTPGGLVYLDHWGSNRHSANAAFISLWAAKYGDPAEAAGNTAWAEGQLGYILGDNGHSFVVGFGVDPPTHYHHRASSCPLPPQSCSQHNWGYVQPGPNPNILYGALVGGPNQDDAYEDIRSDYTRNQAACDYNAAYTGALAAMVEIS
ncbi:uncharacterized protein [Cherax quadricarinatus]